MGAGYGNDPCDGGRKPPVKVVPKSGTNPNFGMNMPLMSSAFDTRAWLSAA